MRPVPRLNTSGQGSARAVLLATGPMVGPGPAGTAMLQGMTTSSQKFTSLWLAGFNNNKTAWNPNNPAPSISGFGGGFAFHSFQIALSNLNNAGSLKNKVSGSKNSNTPNYSETVYYETVPIVFNSSSFSQEVILLR